MKCFWKLQTDRREPLVPSLTIPFWLHYPTFFIKGEMTGQTPMQTDSPVLRIGHFTASPPTVSIYYLLASSLWSTQILLCKAHCNSPCSQEVLTSYL